MLEIFNDVPIIACLTLKNSKTTLEKFQYWKKNPIRIRIFLVNYWNKIRWKIIFSIIIEKFYHLVIGKLRIFLQCELKLLTGSVVIKKNKRNCLKICMEYISNKVIMWHVCTHVFVFYHDPKLNSFKYLWIGVGSVSLH